MKWTCFRIKTTVEAEDILISTLYDIGLEGAQIEDHVPLTALEKEQMFVDIPPETGADDGTAYLNFFVETREDGLLKIDLPAEDEEEEAENADAAKTYSGAFSGGSLYATGEEKTTGTATVDRVRTRIEKELEELRFFGLEIGEGSIQVSETEDLDWVNNWKQYFHQFTIDDILVIPSWEEVQAGNERTYTLHIDPGTAFGTGMHDTTQLCIRQLKKYITKDTELLDVGTGSGILAILSLMFGAAHAVGTDLDPCAAPAVEENCRDNGIAPGKFDLYIGNLVDDPEIQEKVGKDRYDIVVINILAEVLVSLTPAVAPCLKKGGIYITSGILAEKVPLVRQAMEAAGLEVLEVTEQGEWASVTARKN